MLETARPFLVVYVVWHPDFELGRMLAKTLFDHFRRDTYENVTGGTGISVCYRFAVANDSDAPLPIDFSTAETSAVIALADQSLANDPTWCKFLKNIADQTAATGLATRLFPVAMQPNVIEALELDEQAIRWFEWKGDFSELSAKLLGHLTYQFCRMLRHYLEHLRRPEEGRDALLKYLRKVDVFLSHSKHDVDKAGERVAKAIRKQLEADGGLNSFFDVYDIPPGVKFHEVLVTKISVSAVVAVHTDSFSSREWCRREIIEAKRHNVPLVIANCISDQDECGFPYLGNAPIIRLDARKTKRVGVVIRALLDEILKDFLWKCRVELMRSMAGKNIVFLPRPPELIALASLFPSSEDEPVVVVYPNPPLSAAEERLFFEIAPNIQLRSATEWLAGAIR